MIDYHSCIYSRYMVYGHTFVSYLLIRKLLCVLSISNFKLCMLSVQGTASPPLAQTEPNHLSTIYSVELSLHELWELCRTACLFSKALCHHTYWSGISPCASLVMFIFQCVCLFVYMLLKYTAPFPSWWGICFLIVFAKSTQCTSIHHTEKFTS